MSWWRRYWPTVAFFGVGLLISAGLLVHNAVTKPKKIEYFYAEHGQGRLVYHLNSKCKSGLVYVSAEKVFPYIYNEELFCAKCVPMTLLKEFRSEAEVRSAQKTQRAKSELMMKNLWDVAIRKGIYVGTFETFCTDMWKQENQEWIYNYLTSEDIKVMGSELSLFKTNVTLALLDLEE